MPRDPRGHTVRVCGTMVRRQSTGLRHAIRSARALVTACAPNHAGGGARSSAYGWQRQRPVIPRPCCFRAGSCLLPRRLRAPPGQRVFTWRCPTPTRPPTCTPTLLPDRPPCRPCARPTRSGRYCRPTGRWNRDRGPVRVLHPAAFGLDLPGSVSAPAGHRRHRRRARRSRRRAGRIR